MDMPSRPVSPAAESVQPTVEPTPPVLPTTTTTLPEPPILGPCYRCRGATISGYEDRCTVPVLGHITCKQKKTIKI